MGCSGERRKKIKRHEESARSHSKAHFAAQRSVSLASRGIAIEKGEQFYMENIMNMKKTLALWLLAASLVAGIATAGYAQNKTTTLDGNSAPATADQRATDATVLAGCLGRGSGADQYALRGPRVQWWELKSDSVNLRVFLDEEVRVAVVKSPENGGTLTVTDLAIVSPSCTSQ